MGAGEASHGPLRSPRRRLPRYAGVQPRSVATWEWATATTAEPAMSAAGGRCGVISTCVRHVPHFIFHWAHHDRHVFEYRRWPLRYQVSLVSPVSRPARHPHFSRTPLALTQGEAADEAWAWKVGFTFPLGVPPKNTVQVPTSGWERCLRSRLLFSVSPSRGSPLEAQSRRRVRAQWTGRLDPAGFVF